MQKLHGVRMLGAMRLLCRKMTHFCVFMRLVKIAYAAVCLLTIEILRVKRKELLLGKL